MSTVNAIMKGAKIPVGNGPSDAIAELRMASRQKTEQGKKAAPVTLLEMPTVAPPGQDYDGLRPALLMYAAKDRPNNVLRVTYFVIDASQLDSHREAAFQYEVVKRPDSARF
jgi:hypothetical protein